MPYVESIEKILKKYNKEVQADDKNFENCGGKYSSIMFISGIIVCYGYKSLFRTKWMNSI